MQDNMEVQVVSLKNVLLAGFVSLGLMGVASANPDVYTVDVYTGNVGYGFDALKDNASLFTSSNNSQHAEFTYVGPLDFANTASQNGTAAGDLNSTFFGAHTGGIIGYNAITSLASTSYGSFATLSSFLAASGSVAGYGYGSLYIISETGSAYHKAHPSSTGITDSDLSITHDDGVGVYDQAGVLMHGTTTGPTSRITEQVEFGSYDTSGYRSTLPDGYTIAYTRENGTHSVLQVHVPEPISIALLGTGLVGLGIVGRRRPAFA